jgi:hypothetical protein
MCGIFSIIYRVQLSIADHVWKATSAKITESVDSLSNQFCPVFVLDGLHTSTRPILPISPDKLSLWAKTLWLLVFD